LIPPPDGDATVFSKKKPFPATVPAKKDVIILSYNCLPRIDFARDGLDYSTGVPAFNSDFLT